MLRRTFLKGLLASGVGLLLSSRLVAKENILLPAKSFCQIKDYVAHRVIRYPVYQDMYLLGQKGPYDRYILYPVECKLIILYKDESGCRWTEDYRAFNVNQDEIREINQMSVSELFSHYGDNGWKTEPYQAWFNFPTKRFNMYGGTLS